MISAKGNTEDFSSRMNTRQKGKILVQTGMKLGNSRAEPENLEENLGSTVRNRLLSCLKSFNEVFLEEVYV